jgi:RNA polymerase sigma-70 factor (ECF subfamily)
MESPDKELEALLSRLSAGEREALTELVPLVYDELKDRARRQLRREPHTATLSPTELVNEAYLKLAEQNRSILNNRSQFLAVAGLCMERVLLDHARRRLAEKRPRRELRVTLHTEIPDGDIDVENRTLLEALARLTHVAPHLARVVSLRWLAGCTNLEVAALTGLGLATVKRHLTLAKAWLRKELGKPENSKPIH